MKETPHDDRHCPLCQSHAGKLFHQDATRQYIRCHACQLVYVPPRYWLSLDDERATYDLHQNHPHDPGYRRFLSRLATPLLEQLPPHQHGLDFGCGPGPTLSLILQEHGHHVDLYDPFYANHPALLTTTYDFICATEVVEHLRHPNAVFTTLFSQLRPGGYLGLMTKLVTDHHAFTNWHYIRDPTHIAFYHPDTLTYMATRFNATLTIIEKDAILFQTTDQPKPSCQPTT